jgi:biopolymer transport protein ExbD
VRHLLAVALLWAAACKRDAAQPDAGLVPVKILDLPKASVADDFVETIFVVEVNADGTYDVNGQRVAEGEILKRAIEARTKTPDVRAVIRADRNVTYQRVITAMDLIKRGGISRLGFAVSVDSKAP